MRFVKSFFKKIFFLLLEIHVASASAIFLLQFCEYHAILYMVKQLTRAKLFYGITMEQKMLHRPAVCVAL